jgi:putative oxidoreductase
MGGDANSVHLITAQGVESWERAPKSEVARRIAGRIAAHLGGRDEDRPAAADAARRLSDLGLLLLRWVTGAFLVWQSHDNIFSAARMAEFETFLAQFGFVAPHIMAPLCVWAQFLCGILLILGLLTRWAGLVTAVTFVVAVWMVHWPQDFPAGGRR